MYCGQRVRWLISMYFMFIFGPAAVTAARPGLEPSASLSVDDDHRVSQEYNPCLESGARRARHGVVKGDCECVGAATPSKECGPVKKNGVFRPVEGERKKKGCRCRNSAELSRERSVFVRASAVKFCSDILDKTAEAKGKLQQLLAKLKLLQKNLDLDKLPWQRIYRNRAWRGLKPEEKHLLKIASRANDSSSYLRWELGVTEQLCTEVLTGRSTKDQEWYSDAAKLSEHQNARGFGHLDPLVTGSIQSHRQLLEKVCADECKDIVKTTLVNIVNMVEEDVSKKNMPFEQSCADRVVRKAEAEVLGCCGRACGWNNHSCMAWPFFTEKEKVNWLDECCTEFNVLDGSSRDKMCDSVLTKKQVEKISKFNTKVKDHTDVGGAYIGQDPPLLWEEKGLEKFKEELKGLDTMPREGDPVSSDFLEKHPDVRNEGIHHKWFKEEKMTDENGKWSSFTQIGSSNCESTFKKLKKMIQHCPSQTLTQVRDTCLRQERGWQASVKPEPDDMDPSCQEKMIDPSINPPTEVGTPDECLEVKVTDVEDMKRKFFVFNTTDPPDGQFVLEKPILCFSEPKKLRCPPEEDFNGRNVRDIEFNPHKGFADYIYWINLIEESKAE